jgi:hypothetical protein
MDAWSGSAVNACTRLQRSTYVRHGGENSRRSWAEMIFPGVLAQNFKWVVHDLLNKTVIMNNEIPKDWKSEIQTPAA